MTKITAALLAIAIAGTANAAGWRSMRIDASSEAGFNASITALKDRLPRVRKAVLERSLKDIWETGTQAAAAADREYTVSDYLEDVDGLKYKEIVEFTDPSGDTANRYSRQAYTNLYGRFRNGHSSAGSPGAGGLWRGNAGVSTYSGSKILDAGQSARALGRNGGTHF